MKERGNKLYKLVDSVVGNFLIFFMHFFQKKRQLGTLENIENIVVIQLGAIGDTILLSAVLQDIKDTLSNAKITLICSNSNKGIAYHLTMVDTLFVFNIKNPFSSMSKIKKMSHANLVLDFTPWANIGAILAFFLHGDYAVGFKQQNMNRHLLYDSWIEHSNHVHELTNYKNIIQSVGIVKDNFPSLSLSESLNFIVEKKSFVFHLFPGGTKSYMRQWSCNNWVALAKILGEKGFTIYLTGSKDDTLPAEDFCMKAHNSLIINCVGKLSLAQSATLLKSVVALITVNTGILHLADSLAVQTISLNGPTNTKRWGGVHNTSINLFPQNVACSPCLNLGFEYACNDKKPQCMQQLTPQMVINALMENNLL
ncbi:MAG: glycosyltransferase family 9 protein [Treponemataceae bacterium]